MNAKERNNVKGVFSQQFTARKTRGRSPLPHNAQRRETPENKFIKVGHSPINCHAREARAEKAINQGGGNRFIKNNKAREARQKEKGEKVLFTIKKPWRVKRAGKNNKLE